MWPERTEDQTFAEAVAHRDDRKVVHWCQRARLKPAPPLPPPNINNNSGQMGISFNADGRVGKDKPLVLTYLQRAGAPHAQTRGPGCFSRPSVQASASLDALSPDHFGAGETAAGAEPRNPCVSLQAPPRKKKRKINNPYDEKEEEKKEKSYTNINSRVLEMLGRGGKCGFRDASPSLSELPAASLTLVGSAARPALRPPAPLLAIF